MIVIVIVRVIVRVIVGVIVRVRVRVRRKRCYSSAHIKRHRVRLVTCYKGARKS